MVASAGFNNSTTSENAQPPTWSETVSENALEAVRATYKAFGPRELTFDVLLEALDTPLLAGLELAEPLKAVKDLLKDPEDAAAVRIEHPKPQLPLHMTFKSEQSPTEAQIETKKVFDTETRERLEVARHAIYSEVLASATTGRIGFTHASNNAVDWVQKNIKGGENLGRELSRISRVLTIISENVGNGHSLGASVGYAAHYLSGEKKPARTEGFVQ